MKNVSRRLAVLLLILAMGVSLCPSAAFAAEETADPAPEAAETTEAAPGPTVTPEPTTAPEPAATAEPTAAPEPTAVPAPEAVPEQTAAPEVMAEPNDGISTAAADTAAVAYYDPRTGDTQTVDATLLTTGDTAELTDGYYYVKGVVSFRRLTVTGAADLILAGGAELCVTGYSIDASGAALNIWAEPGEGDGRIVAVGDQTAISAGSLNIYGGTVQASGGKVSAGELSIYGGALGFEATLRPITVTGGMTVSGGSVTAESISAGGFTITGGGLTADSVETGGDMTVSGGGITAKSISAGGFIITGGLITANSVTARSFDVSGGSIKLPEGVRLMNIGSPEPLCLLKVENPDDLAVAVDGEPWTPGRHGGESILYAWLRREEHTVQVGDETTTYHYDRSTDTFDSRTGTPYYDPTDGGNKRAEPVSIVRAGRSKWTTGWYVVDARPSFSGRIEVEGDVDLILADGGLLVVGEGIHVPAGSSLTIWQQSETAAGELSAFAPDWEGAVIGGNVGEDGGSVTINGGSIVINELYDGAAIGSAQGGGFGDITVNGGSVRCYAGEDADGAVLGAGSSGTCGNITIAGGAVSAPAFSSGGAVIGTGSQNSVCGDITITGGSVYAGNTDRRGGAIIGTGGEGANCCGTITIRGGDVYAETVSTAAWAVGLGYAADECGGVVITGGSVYAAGGAGMIAPQPTNGTDPVYLLKVPNPGRQAVSIDDQPWPPFYDEHVENHGLCAWVTGEEHTVKVGDAAPTTYVFDEATKTFRVPVSVSYYDPEKGPQGPVSATAVTGSETVWTEGWYAAGGSLMFSGRVAVQGHVDLILTAGCALVSQGGINIPAGSSLTIWQEQSGQEGTFQILADPTNAAIGGNANESGGSVTVNGGSIIIYNQDAGAGIGSGYGGSFGDITVRGGDLVRSPQNGSGAFLGAGDRGSCGSITITGGDVEARTLSGAAAIGTGYRGSVCGDITITGGDIEAASASGAAIGCGGLDDTCGKITITGGDVRADAAGEDAFGIGVGSQYSVCGGVVITGGSVYAAGGAGMIAPQPTNGSVPVYLLRVPNPARGPVYIDGEPWPPAWYSRGLNALCAWVPGADHTAKIGAAGEETGYIFLDDTFVPADDYDWDAPSWAWADDCGTATLTIPALDGTGEPLTHTVMTVKTGSIPAACETPGMDSYAVSVRIAGHDYKDEKQVVAAAALGHDWDTEHAALNEDGNSVTVTCKNDGTHKTQAVLYWEEVPSGYKAPDCKTGVPGERVYDLNFVLDGAIQQFRRQTVRVPAEHAWGGWQEVADTEGTTVLERTCTVCGTAETSTHWHVWRFPAADDTANVQWDAPEKGCLTVKVTCEDSTCEYHSKPMELVVDPSAIRETVTVPVTCTGDGTTVYTAALALPGKDGDYTGTYTKTVTVPATGHIWDTEDPVWQADGQVLFRFVCINDETHTHDELAAIRAETRRLPACEEPGLRYLYATAAWEDTVAETWRYEQIPALGHDYKNGKCTRCGAVDPSRQGDVTVEVSAEADAPAVTIPAESQAALESAVLTAADRARVAAGVSVAIELEVTNADETAPAEDREAVADAIESGLPGYGVGQYLDVSLYKRVGDSAPTAIAGTGEKQITLTVAVPEALRAPDRTFRIIRVHGGEAAVLKDLDSEADTITFRTNLFSTYAIVYKDKDEAAPPAPTAAAAPAAAKAAPETGDGTDLLPWALLLLACGGALLGLGRRRRRS